MTTDRSDVLVIGAGLSGLVAGYELRRRGLDVRVIEAGASPGGVIGTCERDGARYELGPNSALDNAPEIGTLLGHLGITTERVDASSVARRRFVVREGVPIALPTSPGAFVRTGALSARGKLRLLREPFIAPAPPGSEESIAAFVRRRLGQEVLDYAVDPFVSGIYAGDPETISVRAAFPRLHALEQDHGSLIRGLFASRRPRAARPGNGPQPPGPPRSFSFRQGMGVLPHALAGALPDLLLHTPAHFLNRTAQGDYAVAVAGPEGRRTLHARAVVCAVPAPAAARLFDGADIEAAGALCGIEYAPVCSVASLYPRTAITHPLDGFGFLVPRVERRRILGTLFSSSMFPERAPEGHALLTTFVGGRRSPELLDLGDEAIAGIVAVELAALLGSHGTAAWHVVTRWPQAIPQYTLGHLDRMRVLDAAEARSPGLFICANYRGGVSIGDCIKSAHAVAGRVAAHLASYPPRR